MKRGDNRYQITEWCKRMLSGHVKPGDFCIDATMGKGNDTVHLCRLVGETGRVLAMDIQESALVQTRERLEREGFLSRTRLVLDSHSNMKKYVEAGSADCIVFNLGYLPGGDHTVATRAETTIEAISQGLSLLKSGGLMSICIYSGGDSGFEERDAVLAYLKELDPGAFLVILTEYYNRPNNPPIPAFIIKK